jgi:hypothetical protein
MSLRTRVGFFGTGRRAKNGRFDVRPAELYFLSVAAVMGLVLPEHGCGPEPAMSASAATPIPAVASPTATPAPDLFATSVRPMLVQRCAPCHEPGGKLYEKLPFDNPGVVAAHAPGMMRRLKGEDREALEKWIASLPPNSAAP